MSRVGNARPSLTSLSSMRDAPVWYGATEIGDSIRKEPKKCHKLTPRQLCALVSSLFAVVIIALMVGGFTRDLDIAGSEETDENKNAQQRDLIPLWVTEAVVLVACLVVGICFRDLVMEILRGQDKAAMSDDEDSLELEAQTPAVRDSSGSVSRVGRTHSLVDSDEEGFVASRVRRTGIGRDVRRSSSVDEDEFVDDARRRATHADDSLDRALLNVDTRPESEVFMRARSRTTLLGAAMGRFSVPAGERLDQVGPELPREARGGGGGEPRGETADEATQPTPEGAPRYEAF